MRAKEIIPASKPRNFVAKNQQTGGAGAHRDKKKEQKQGYEKHRGKSVAEGSEELRDSLLDVLHTIYKGAASGENMIDVLADELNQYYDEIDQSGDETLQQAYSYMMDNGQEAEDDPTEMAKIARTAISMLNQKEGAEMEERYRDPEDWDEGNTEPPNNFAIYINGKKWKVFAGRGYYADDEREMKQYYDLKAWAQKKSDATGKKWEVSRTGEAPTA